MLYVLVLAPAILLALDVFDASVPIGPWDYLGSFVVAALATVVIRLARLWPFKQRPERKGEESPKHMAAVYHVTEPGSYFIAICECGWTSAIQELPSAAAELAEVHTPTVDRMIHTRP